MFRACLTLLTSRPFRWRWPAWTGGYVDGEAGGAGTVRLSDWVKAILVGGSYADGTAKIRPQPVTSDGSTPASVRLFHTTVAIVS